LRNRLLSGSSGAYGCYYCTLSCCIGPVCVEYYHFLHAASLL
jgi:hypothetical protein